MSLKKCVKQDIIAFEPYDIEKIGLNILHGKQGEIIDLETGKAPITKALITNDVNAILIPNHCKSVKTTVESGMRLCAFKTESDDYTVIVELDKSNSPRDISIKFDKLIGRKFYKHIYNRPCCRNGNATLPPVCGVMNVDNRICDKVSGDYQEIVYTTIPPIGQVVLPNVEVLLSPAQKYLPCASLIDCENAGDVAWEIIKTVGNECSFYIDKYNQNRIAATREAMTGDMCAVKVYSKINPKIYSIMIVKIK